MVAALLMVEAAILFKLLPASILDIYKVFEHNDMTTNVQVSSLTQLYPRYLAQIMVIWVTCGVNMMSLCHG